MGFFTDLKEDLSQAVNELNDQIKIEDEVTVKAQAAEEPPQEAEQPPLSLDEMLDNIDDVSLPEETVEEEPVADDWVSAGIENDMEPEPEPEPEAPQPVEEPAVEPEVPSVEPVVEAVPEPEPVWEKEADDRIRSVSQREESRGAGNNMETTTSRVALDETSVITEGMLITGDIISEGSINLIGTVNGNIDVLGKLNVTGHINGNSKAAEIYAESAKINGEIVSEGAVKIGASSVVIGNISACSAVIAGAVKGDIDVHGPVILDTSAIVMGNIKSKSVQINNGAVIEGMCSQCYADVNPSSFFDGYKPTQTANKGKAR